MVTTQAETRSAGASADDPATAGLRCAHAGIHHAIHGRIAMTASPSSLRWEGGRGHSVPEKVERESPYPTGLFSRDRRGHALIDSHQGLLSTCSTKMRAFTTQSIKPNQDLIKKTSGRPKHNERIVLLQSGPTRSNSRSGAPSVPQRADLVVTDYVRMHTTV